jgi:hypothetical protein
MPYSRLVLIEYTEYGYSRVRLRRVRFCRKRTAICPFTFYRVCLESVHAAVYF